MTELVAIVSIVGGWSACIYGVHCVYPPAAFIAAGASFVVVGVGIVKVGKKAKK